MAVKFEFSFAQTTHAVALACTLLVAVLLSPVGGDWVNLGGVALLVRLVHLSSFSAWFGTQIWVTFFAGLTMFRVLTRRAFATAQGKLFPKYFLLGTVLSSLTTLTFLCEHPFKTWDSRQELIQGASFLVTMAMVLLNLLYLAPTAVRVQSEKLAMEKEIGGDECVGKVDEDKLKVLNLKPRYVQLSKQFSRLHAYSAVTNLTSLASQSFHLWYLAGHLNSI